MGRTSLFRRCLWPAVALGGAALCAMVLDHRVSRGLYGLASGMLLLLSGALVLGFFLECGLRLLGSSTKRRVQARVLLVTCILVVLGSELVLRFATDRYQTHSERAGVEGYWSVYDYRDSSWFHVYVAPEPRVVRVEEDLDVGDSEAVEAFLLQRAEAMTPERAGKPSVSAEGGNSYRIETGGTLRAHALVDAARREIQVHPTRSPVEFKGAEFHYRRRINSLGLPDREFPIEKSEGEFRVIALGDSFTEGVGVAQAASWPAVLEREARERTGRNISCLNAGVAGSDLFFEYVLLKEKLLPLSPDLVIVNLNWSDVEEVSRRGGFERFLPDGRVRFSVQAPAWEWAYASSFVVRAVVHDVLQYDSNLIKKDELRSREKESVRLLETAARSFHSLAEEEGFALLFVCHPLRNEVQAGRYEGVFDGLVQRLKRDQTLPILDVLERSRSDGVMGPDNAASFFWPLDGHCNEKGYRHLATVIDQALQERGLVPD